MSDVVPVPSAVRFLISGTAGMLATSAVQPMDLIKTRMQVCRGGVCWMEVASTTTLLGIAKHEGILKLYTGLSAGLFRQATYCTTRLGIYTSLLATYKEKNGGGPNLLTNLVMGMTAGGLGAIVGTPGDVAWIRMMSDRSLPVRHRRNYRNVFHALSEIYKEGGVRNLWSGVTPTIGRAIVLNGAQLTTYSQTKNWLINSGVMSDDLPCHFSAAMCAGLVATVCMMPIDMAKTRLQSMKTVNGVPQYKGTVDVLKTVVRGEGLFALWKGFLPNWMKQGPHTVITMITLEMLNKAYQDMKKSK